MKLDYRVFDPHIFIKWVAKTKIKKYHIYGENHAKTSINKIMP